MWEAPSSCCSCAIDTPTRQRLPKAPRHVCSAIHRRTCRQLAHASYAPNPRRRVGCRTSAESHPHSCQVFAPRSRTCIGAESAPKRTPARGIFPINSVAERLTSGLYSRSGPDRQGTMETRTKAHQGVSLWPIPISISCKPLSDAVGHGYPVRKPNPMSMRSLRQNAVARKSPPRWSGITAHTRCRFR